MYSNIICVLLTYSYYIVNTKNVNGDKDLHEKGMFTYSTLFWLPNAIQQLPRKYESIKKALTDERVLVLNIVQIVFVNIC